jgi:8-oxo-dGTP diphosphatase
VRRITSLVTEREFLENYDATAFPAVAVAVDLVIATIADGALHILLTKRPDHPACGSWALPGSILQPDEDLDACARRTASRKAELDRLQFRQFETFGSPARDPRLRVVSVAYLALTTAPPFLRASSGDERLAATVRYNGDETSLIGATGQILRLPFDHDEIVQSAVRRLRIDLDRTVDVFGFLSDEFTLRDLQIVHEAVRGETVNKPAFRKRMLDSGRLEPVGRKDEGSAFRPAELYRLREGAR